MAANPLPALQAKRANLIAEADAFDLAALTDEQRKRFDDIEAAVKVLDGDIARVERQQALARTTPAVETVDVAGEPVAEAPRAYAGRNRAADKPWGTDTGAPFGEFLQAVRRQSLGLGTDPRLFEAAAQGAGEQIGADGGFLVGKDQAAGIIERMHDTGRILKLINPIPISAASNGIEINAIKETSRTTGSRFGGVQGYWVDEGVAPPQSRPKFRKIELKLKKLAALGYATDELLADAVALQSVMTRAFAEELVFLTEDAIINGSGAGQPLGILNAACTVSVAEEGGQTAATVNGTNISKMWARLPARSKANSVWLHNVDVEPQLDALTFPSGTTVVGARFANYDDQGLLNLKGRPAIPVEYCATLGTVGDIILADFSQYAMIQREAQQASSMHVAFTTDEMAFRAVYRVDGQPTWESAVTPFKGSNTISPFVTLATRS